MSDRVWACVLYNITDDCNVTSVCCSASWLLHCHSGANDGELAMYIGRGVQITVLGKSHPF